MKTLFAIILFLIPLAGFSQSEYKASNGKTYHVGDTVKIALGSMPEGNFKYVQVSQPAFLPPRRGNDMNARKDAAHTNGIIKKIKKGSMLTNNADKTIFVVKTGNIMNFDVWIEEAIASCEVTPCANNIAEPPASTAPTLGVADELLKLKKLLDSGAITQAEYNAQKKKLLGQ